MHASTYDSSTYGSTPGAGEVIGVVIGLALYLGLIVFAVYLYMRVARKAGWTLWHGLLMLVPVANVVFVIMFAFTEWPVERRLREAEARLALATGGSPYGHGPDAAYGAAPYGSPAPYGSSAPYGAPAPYAAQAPYGAPVDAPPVPPAPGRSSPWEPPAATPAGR